MGNYKLVSSRFWKERVVRPRKYFFLRSLGVLKDRKFTDYTGNVWPMCGALPTTNRGGLIR